MTELTRTTELTHPATTGTRARITASREPNALLVYLRHAIWRHARGVLFWTIGVTLYTTLLVLSFPAFEETGALDVSQYPEAMREAFNLQSMDTIQPYLSSQVFNYLPLVLMFIPITILAGAIAGAEERGALDILFGNPLPRHVYVVAYWLTVVVLMLAMLSVLGVATWLTAVLIDIDLSFGDSMLAAMNVFPITMAAGGLALLLSAVVRSKAIAVGVPAALLFLMYLADILGKISSDFELFRNLSFFRAYGDPLQDGMPWAGVAILLAIAIALAALAIPAFQRRDIYT
jgi:ABC-2 type transport system permease protein